jgi:ABC-type sugar transport system permease subunit
MSKKLKRRYLAIPILILLTTYSIYRIIIDIMSAFEDVDFLTEEEEYEQ